jgi:hypothetical protein
MLGTDKYGGLITSIAESEAVSTAPYSVLILRGISSKLQAQAISGYMDVVLGVRQARSTSNFYWHIHVYVTQGDTDTVRGILVNNYVENTTNTWTTTAKGTSFQFAVPISPLAITANDRIVIEIGFVARNVTTTSESGTIYYGTKTGVTIDDAPDLAVTSTQVSTNAGFIDFTQTLLFQVIPEEIGHIGVQSVEDAPSALSRVSHQQIQTAEITRPATEIAHIIIQAVEINRPPIVLGDISGIYFINPLKANKRDSYYDADRKVPNPTIRTALLGD